LRGSIRWALQVACNRAEHFVKHRLGEAFGLGIVAAATVAVIKHQSGFRDARGILKEQNLARWHLGYNLSEGAANLKMDGT
jgi:hypothetical protein